MAPFFDDGAEAVGDGFAGDDHGDRAGVDVAGGVLEVIGEVDGGAFFFQVELECPAPREVGGDRFGGPVETLIFEQGVAQMG